jgi:hypothetical protein
MKYVLKDIKLRTVKEGSRNAGSLFIQATVVNPDDMFDDDGTMISFNERIVKAFAEYLMPSVKADTPDAFGRPVWKPSLPKDANKPLPETLTTLTHAQFETYRFPNDRELVAVDTDGTPLRDSKDQLVTRRSITILTKKTVDNETGETRYAKGWGLEEQGDAMMRRMYRPKSQFTNESSGGIVLPQDAETPLINGATAPAAAPAV